MARKAASIVKPPSRSHGRRHLVAVVVFDGVVLADVGTPCVVFDQARDAHGHRMYEVRICGPRRSVDTPEVGLNVSWSLDVLRKADTIIVPGIVDLDCQVPKSVISELHFAIGRGARVASICTGAFVLAQTGALDGNAATTHWLAAPELARRFPKISVNADVLYVDGGKILTAAGVAAGFDLCLHLVRRDFGAELAARAARMVVMPLERAGGQAQFIVHEEPDVPHATFGPLLAWVERNLRGDLSLPALARRASLSDRTLSRRFKSHVGITPGAWVARARVREAQRLLETTVLSVEAIAEAAGYASASVMRERFAAVLGVSPLAYRRSFSA